jgi:hypothetical protein
MRHLLFLSLKQRCVCRNIRCLLVCSVLTENGIFSETTTILGGSNDILKRLNTEYGDKSQFSATTSLELNIC